MEEIKIVIDQDTLDRYDKFYFRCHPKAKKLPIERPRHPSINEWFILPRPQMNALKILVAGLFRISGMKIRN